jgi:hypothetical protein
VETDDGVLLSDVEITQEESLPAHPPVFRNRA